MNGHLHVYGRLFHDYLKDGESNQEKQHCSNKTVGQVYYFVIGKLPEEEAKTAFFVLISLWLLFMRPNAFLCKIYKKSSLIRNKDSLSALMLTPLLLAKMLF